jgi:hypothetical protein
MESDYQSIPTAALSSTTSTLISSTSSSSPSLTALTGSSLPLSPLKALEFELESSGGSQVPLKVTQISPERSKLPKRSSSKSFGKKVPVSERNVSCFNLLLSRSLPRHPSLFICPPPFFFLSFFLPFLHYKICHKLTNMIV